MKIFWRPLRELLGTRRSRCAECNGVTYREGELRKRMVVNRQFIRNRTDLQLHMSSSQHEDRRGNPQAEDLIVMESTGIDIILGQNWSVRNKLEM